MLKAIASPMRSIQWDKILLALFIVVLLATLGLSASRHSVTLRVQPQLLELAAERPDEMVRVIVQKVVRDSSIEGLVARLGGEVVRELPIINAFSASLPASAVEVLAEESGVRRISLDAPVQGSGTPSEPIR